MMLLYNSTKYEMPGKYQAKNSIEMLNSSSGIRNVCLVHLVEITTKNIHDQTKICHSVPHSLRTRSNNRNHPCSGGFLGTASPLACHKVHFLSSVAITSNRITGSDTVGKAESTRNASRQ